MKNFIDTDDAKKQSMSPAPEGEQCLNDPSMPSLDGDSVPIDITHDGRFDVSGIVENLARNIGMARGLDGDAYSIGINVKLLNALIAFMQHVIETNELPYRIKCQVDGRVRAVETRMAHFMDLLPSFAQLAFDGLALSPDLALFHRLYVEHPISQQHILFDAMTDQAVAEICNDFVVTLRVEGKRMGIKRMLKNWQRNANEKAKRLLVYLNALHERYARLMVIRLDLMYRQTACLGVEQAKHRRELLEARNAKERLALIQGETVDDADDELPRVDIFTVTQDWGHFKANMRGKPSLFRHLVGYVCSIEFSSTGGHHLHVALIFDGSQVKQHEWLGDQIGQYWIEITGGRGYFHNCNRGSYKYPGVGLIEHHDMEKRRNLMRTLMYLAKKDQFVRVKASPKSKTFLTGHMPKPPTGRTGRPRIKGLPVLPGLLTGIASGANDG